MVQLSRSQVSNLETNFNEPDLKSLDRIASFFNTSIDALLGRNIPESEEQLKLSSKRSKRFSQAWMNLNENNSVNNFFSTRNF